MPESRTTDANKNQDEQEQLVKRALEIPGVAAALEVYDALRPFAHRAVGSNVTVRFSTGGNA